MTAPPIPPEAVEAAIFIPCDRELTPEEVGQIRRDWNFARLGATPADRLAALLALGERALAELDNAIIADMEAGEAQ